MTSTEGKNPKGMWLVSFGWAVLQRWLMLAVGSGAGWLVYLALRGEGRETIAGVVGTAVGVVVAAVWWLWGWDKLDDLWREGSEATHQAIFWTGIVVGAVPIVAVVGVVVHYLATTPTRATKPARSPVKQQTQVRVEEVGSPGRWQMGREVRRGRGWYDIVVRGTVVANLHRSPDILPEIVTIYDQRGNTLRSYSFVGVEKEGRSLMGVGVLRRRDGERIVATLVLFSGEIVKVWFDLEGNFNRDETDPTADLFYANGLYGGRMYWLGETLGMYNAEDEWVPVADREYDYEWERERKR
ncbi:MAG: hypothetical protein L0214_01930 [candidate division NC10 bacterium]|nr:hypothetical protein [candidate division NC10 bacterium]